MTAPVTASEQDLRTLAGIVSDHRDDLPAQGLPQSLLADLKDQVGCDKLLCEGIDSTRRETWFGQAIPLFDTWDEDSDRAHWQHHSDWQPCSYPDRTGDLRSIVKIADFYSARQWHSTGMYSDWARPHGLEHQLQLCLPAGPGRTVRLFLFRGYGADFSERDRALLTLLRPHLRQAYLDAERRRHPAPQLTPRHWDVLHLLAAGHTNTQIARRLGLSEGTVRTHLENIYGRLNVSSRTAAVTCAFPEWAAAVTRDQKGPLAQARRFPRRPATAGEGHRPGTQRTRAIAPRRLAEPGSSAERQRRS
jgi:DNA-binding CsgD family transcriptional regulator